MRKRLWFTILLVVIIACLVQVAGGQAAPAAQQGITQAIVVNGQQAQGVTIVQNGAVQSQTCASPQQYMTVDQASGGWTCFDQASGVWLLHALPPAQSTTVYQQPPTYVAVAPPVYSYYGYPYYYPYSYPYFYGPALRLGFGFGFGYGYRSPAFVGRPFVPFRGSVGFPGRFGGGHGGVGHGGRR